ncbi:MAG TPA: phytanoyl-CoA dioxygenase family protein, partial [Acidimicrobiales bacterium]|nr:phytanoyl-CoA dioxygenase family protein [Acidimicrobiales bacterium]
RTLGAIDDIVGRGRWRRPKDWGAYFILFPNRRSWTVPWNAWHLDHDYASPLAPVDGLKVHSMFGDVAPRAGGMTIVAGSHRLVAQHFASHPPRPGTKAAQLRKQLMQSSDYLRVLGTDGGGGEARTARFVDAVEAVDGVPLQVVELTAAAGDVILIHPLVLHTRPTNAGTEPRFLLNKDLYLTSSAASPRSG